MKETMSLYPLKFKPRFVEKIWGGRKIESVLGKSLPPEKLIGESWEIYDFPPGVVEGSKDWISAEIVNGPLAGRTLHSLVIEFGKHLTGEVALAGSQGQFPILIKYLDARDDLSVQVHPDQKYADSHPNAHLKTEAWYVVQHDENARLLKGFVPGATPEGFKKAIKDGTVESQINAIKVKNGECFFLPSGTIHALGGGILAAEVQTPSDTTFRVFDFNRIDPGTGKLRALHVDQAMECIDFNAPDTKKIETANSPAPTIELVKSPYFHLEKIRHAEGNKSLPTHASVVIWMVLEGNGELKSEAVSEPTRFHRGDTLLLPASLKGLTLQAAADCTVLETTFPKR